MLICRFWTLFYSYACFLLLIIRSDDSCNNYVAFGSGLYLLCNLRIISYRCADWGPKIDVVGFCFLDLASNYEPPEELLSWLKAGPKPIYIGFGSLVSLSNLSLVSLLS